MKPFCFVSRILAIVAHAVLLLGLSSATFAQTLKWPPDKVNFVANPNPNYLGTTGGVFNGIYTVQWVGTINASDNYTGGSNPPNLAGPPYCDAVEAINWNFTNAIVPPASDTYHALYYIFQKQPFPKQPTVFPWIDSASLQLDVQIPYTSDYTIDTSGLSRYLRTKVRDDSMAGRVDAGAGNSLDPPAVVYFVYKVTAPGAVGKHVTVNVAQGYYNYTSGILASGSIRVITRTPVAGWDHTYSTTTTEDPQTQMVTRWPTDIAVNFTIPSGGVYYFVVPAYVGSHVIMSSSCIGAPTPPSGSLLLTSTVDTRYGVDVYSLTSN